MAFRDPDAVRDWIVEQVAAGAVEFRAYRIESGKAKGRAVSKYPVTSAEDPADGIEVLLGNAAHVELRAFDAQKKRMDQGTKVVRTGATHAQLPAVTKPASTPAGEVANAAADIAATATDYSLEELSRRDEVLFSFMEDWANAKRDQWQYYADLQIEYAGKRWTPEQWIDLIEKLGPLVGRTFGKTIGFSLGIIFRQEGQTVGDAVRDMMERVMVPTLDAAQAQLDAAQAQQSPPKQKPGAKPKSKK